MKEVHSEIGLGRICGLFGITRQAYYQWRNALALNSMKDSQVLFLVKQIREKHPKIGVRKLHYLLHQDFQRLGIKMGRDGLFDLLAAYNLLIVKRKRKVRTTHSYHRFKKYPNLIKGHIPHKANQIWVSDITYIRTGNDFKYLFLVSDAYSKKVVGYALADNLDTSHAVKALQDAIKNSCQSLSGLIPSDLS